MGGDAEAPRRSVAFPPECPAALHSPASRDFSTVAVRGGVGWGACREFGLGRKTLKIKVDIYKPSGFGG